MASLIPLPRSDRSNVRAASGFCMTSRSVTSSCRQAAGRLVIVRTRCTCSSRASPKAISARDRLTLTSCGAPLGSLFRQRANARQASSITHRPTSTISPDSSAIGMNSLGET